MNNRFVRRRQRFSTSRSRRAVRRSSPVVNRRDVRERTDFSIGFKFSKVKENRTTGRQDIRSFSAQKRRSSVRKQQRPIDSTNLSNGYLTSDENRCESTCFFPPPSPYQHYHRSSIGNSPSIPSLHHYSYRHRLNEHFDAYSFNDIEMSSSTTTTTNRSKFPELQQQNRQRSSSKSGVSSGTTDLSAYSTQSLLKKLLDKAQLLDHYYNQLWTPSNQRSSLSLNLIGAGRGANPRSYSFATRQRKSPSRRSRAVFGNVSSDSSRTDLYHDEDNVLKELIRFNNDIDLILSRLEMEGEGTTTAAHPRSSTHDDQQVSLPSTTMQDAHVEQ